MCIRDSYVVILYSCSHNFPFALNGQRQLTPEFHVYDHPLWSNWHALWNMKPFELDPMHLSIPSYETEFQGVLFRLFLNPSHQILGSPIFHQGATLVFKGYNDPHNRYVIEWCQQKDHRYAYLKVVGTSKHGNPLPYNDPLYPSFILVVPRNLSTVPRPPRLTKLLRSSSKPTKRIPRFFCHHWLFLNQTQLTFKLHFIQDLYHRHCALVMFSISSCRTVEEEEDFDDFISFLSPFNLLSHFLIRIHVAFNSSEQDYFFSLNMCVPP